MTLMHVRIQFQCDGCGRVFLIEPPNDMDLTGYENLFDMSTDMIGGPILRYVEEKDNRQYDHGLASSQAGQHLCPGCTIKVDNFVTHDGEATEAEIKTALETPMFQSAVNPPDELHEHGSDEYCAKCHHHLDVVDLFDGCPEPDCPLLKKE